MIHILPVEVPGYIIPFLIKDCDGILVESEMGNYYNISIEPQSVLGMFLRRNILPDYKIKNYSITIFTKKKGEKIAYSAEVLEYKNAAEYRVDLNFNQLEDFYKFLNSYFRISFYFYVKGFSKGSTSSDKIKKAIDQYVEDYHLLEYGYNESRLRKILDRYNCKGGLHILQRNNELPQLFFDS